MKNWEKMFSSLRKGTKTHKNTDAYRAAFEARPASGASPLTDAAGSGRMPRTFEEMRRHLEDIWANILLESGGKIDLLMFCGATPGAGCSFISFHMALVLAAVHSMKTLYVDTAVEDPGHIPCIPGMTGRAGLAGFFNGEAQLDSLVATTDYANLFVLPRARARACMEKPSARRRSKNWRRLAGAGLILPYLTVGPWRLGRLRSNSPSGFKTLSWSAGTAIRSVKFPWSVSTSFAKTASRLRVLS